MFYKKISINDNAEVFGKNVAHELLNNKIVHCVGAFKDVDFYIECSKHIGDLLPMEEDSDGEKTGKFFTDIKYPYDEKSNSFSHSNTRQPLHTDGSYEVNAPQISFFHCLEKACFGGATVFFNFDYLVTVLEKHDPKMLQELRTTSVKHFKGSDFKERPIIGDKNILTWNYYRCEESELRDKFHDFLENKVVGGGLVTPAYLDVGDVIFFRDEELLHGRNSFIGSRWLQKGGIKIE